MNLQFIFSNCPTGGKRKYFGGKNRRCVCADVMNSLEPFQSLLQIDFVFRPVLQHHPLIFFQMRREFKGCAGSFVQLLFINLKTLKASRGLRKECRLRYLGDSQTSEWSTSPGGLLKPQWLGAALPALPAPPQWFWLCRWRVAPKDLNLWPFPGDSDAAGSGTPLPDQRLPLPARFSLCNIHLYPTWCSVWCFLTLSDPSPLWPGMFVWACSWTCPWLCLQVPEWYSAPRDVQQISPLN